jgi:hypothetical protein
VLVQQLIKFHPDVEFKIQVISANREEKRSLSIKYR